MRTSSLDEISDLDRARCKTGRMPAGIATRRTGWGEGKRRRALFGDRGNNGANYGARQEWHCLKGIFGRLHYYKSDRYATDSRLRKCHSCLANSFEAF